MVENLAKMQELEGSVSSTRKQIDKGSPGSLVRQHSDLMACPKRRSWDLEPEHLSPKSWSNPHALTLPALVRSGRGGKQLPQKTQEEFQPGPQKAPLQRPSKDSREFRIAISSLCSCCS